jgi:drug/metabolite transporter (DMT)-like permease
MATWRFPGAHVATPPREDRIGLAIGMMLLTYAAFTCLDSSAKWLVTSGVSPWAAVFVRYAVHLAIVAALVLPVAGMRSLSSRSPRLEILRAVLLLGSTLLNFTAVKYLPLTVTATIMFAMPIFITVLSIPLLGETVGVRRWAAILVGFCGIVIVMQPWTGQFHWAMLASLGATICGSFYTILTRRLAGIDSTNTQQLYAALVATLGVAPLAAVEWTPPEGTLAWVLFLCMGVFGWLGHQLLTAAHRYAPASVLAPFVYTQLIYMTLSSWVVFSQPPTVWVLLGAPIVAGSGFYIWWRERQLAAGQAGERRRRT